MRAGQWDRISSLHSEEAAVCALAGDPSLEESAPKR
jgi:hypothetical protein